jgi:hypothetical protein
MRLIDHTRIDLISGTFLRTRTYCGKLMANRTRFDLISLTFLMFHVQVIGENVALFGLKAQPMQSILK